MCIICTPCFNGWFQKVVTVICSLGFVGTLSGWLSFALCLYNIMEPALIKQQTQMTFDILCYFQCFISFRSGEVPVMNVFSFPQTYIHNNSTNIAQVPFLENDNLVYLRFLGSANEKNYIEHSEKTRHTACCPVSSWYQFSAKKTFLQHFSLAISLFYKRMDSNRERRVTTTNWWVFFEGGGGSFWMAKICDFTALQLEVKEYKWFGG